MEHGAELPPELAVAVGERFKAFVEGQVRSGRYRDAAEVVRAALRLLESQEPPEGLPSDAEIRAMVEEGDASGESAEDPDAFFDRLEAKYAAMAAGQRGGEGGRGFASRSALWPTSRASAITSPPVAIQPAPAPSPSSCGRAVPGSWTSPKRPRCARSMEGASASCPLVGS